MPQRVLPHDLTAEASVLGSCLLSSKCVTAALDEVLPHHFYFRSHQLLFEVMQTLYLEGTAIDAISVHRQLEERHLLDAVGKMGGGTAAAVLAELGCMGSVVPENVKRHAQIVREMWGKRRLIDVFTSPMQGAWNGAKPQDVLRAVEKAVITAHGEIVSEAETRVVSAGNAAMWLAEKVQSGVDPTRGVATPFRCLPRFEPGRLYVLGGYPKDGKTTAMMQFVLAAAREGKRVGIPSIEMGWEDLTTRLVASYGIPYQGLQEGFVHDNYKDQFTHALNEVAKLDVDIIDDAAATVADLHRYQRIGKYDFLVIDYLQRMSYKDRWELNEMVKGITTLARTANIPILLLSQFSRQPNAPLYTHGYPQPQMHFFAETSVIEKEASMCLSIWRPRDADTGLPTSEAKLLVMANRYGPTSIHDLHFDADHVRFTERARGY